jgi:hypothetical protein
MKMKGRQNLLAGAFVGALAISGCTKLGPVQEKGRAQESRFDELANATFAENRPTKETAQTLRDELLFQRATQTYLWALPLINTLGMKAGSEKALHHLQE